MADAAAPEGNRIERERKMYHSFCKSPLEVFELDQKSLPQLVDGKSLKGHILIFQY